MSQALWDSFGIENSTMLGWWEDTEQGNGTVPIRASSPSLKVTVYLKKGVKALIVLADWDELSRDVSCTLTYDWDALGLDKASATLSAPLLPPFRKHWPAFSFRCRVCLIQGLSVAELAPVATASYTFDQTIDVNVTNGGLVLLLE